MASATAMSMAPSAASTAVMAMPTSTSHMSMGGASLCKISMLWNWNTVDACFISSTWRITSNGMFAGSCLGVILLVISLEFLRRAGREYDRYIVDQFKHQIPRFSSAHENTSSRSPSSTGRADSNSKDLGRVDETFSENRPYGPRNSRNVRPFRPSFLQQLVRAGLHMIQFAVAYFVMLLAMYYNGYFIICILIGAFGGAFIFNWEQLATNDEREVTGCCG